MATSGSFLYDPTLAELVDEAWERCGKKPREFTAEHLLSCRRSANLMLKAWHNKGVRQWAMEEETKLTTVGMQSFTLEDGTVDVFSMVLQRDGIVTPMEPISRTDYQNIHDKAMQGRPDRYFIQRDRSSQTAFIWQAGENTTDTIRYWRMRQLEVVGRASNTLDMPDRFQDAFAAGLAARLAEKYAPDREGGLIAKAAVALKEAIDEDRERAPLAVKVRFGR